MPNLVERIEQAAQGDRDVVFLMGGTEDRVTWRQLHQEAKGVAATLQHHGVKPGHHVAILGPTTRELVTAIQATWLCGAAVVVLPLPMRMGSIEDFVAQTRQRVQLADTDLLLIDHQLAPFVEPEPGDPPMVRLDELAGDADAFVRFAGDPDGIAILQFTSGSTSEPKGVVLPDRALCANLDAVCDAGGLIEHEVFLSWLPLYHDMGLVGMLTVPMTKGRRLVLAAPQDFMASPSRWMEWLSTYGGTMTAGPNFAWVLAARALKRLEGLDLSPLRLALNGAEPVDPDNVDAFVAAATRHGMRPGAVFPAFGMAEVGIGAAFPPPLRGLAIDVVDRRVLETERYAAPVDPSARGARRLARLGRPVPGLEMRVVDPDSREVLREREVGELELTGTSLCAGYYRRPDVDAAVFRDGWLRTGDLAYLVDGELVVCGRIKDVIIVGGRNVFPEDIERAVGELDDVRTGNVVAFGIEGRRGTQQIVVVAETKLAEDSTPEARQQLRRAVGEKVRQVADVAARDVVLVAPGSVPKTSSGKLQRSKCRERYEAGELEPVTA